MGAKYTEAQKAATLKYLKANIAKITVGVRKELKEQWKQEAADRKLNLSQFIVYCVSKEIEKILKHNLLKVIIILKSKKKKK